LYLWAKGQESQFGDRVVHFEPSAPSGDDRTPQSEDQ
jgi:hypothetical protein